MQIEGLIRFQRLFEEVHVIRRVDVRREEDAESAVSQLEGLVGWMGDEAHLALPQIRPVAEFDARDVDDIVDLWTKPFRMVGIRGAVEFGSE